MDAGEASSTSPEPWAAGLPCVGRRPLVPAEHRAVARRLQRRIAAIVVTALAFALAFTLATSAFDHLHPELATRLGTPLAAGLAASGVLGALLGLVVGRRRWRVAVALGAGYLLVVAGFGSATTDATGMDGDVTWVVVVALAALGDLFAALRLVDAARLLLRTPRIVRDLRAAVVEQYAGRGDRSATEAARRRFAEPRSSEPRSTEYRMDLLPTSGLVLRAGGHELDRLELAHVARVAPAAPHAFRADLPRGLAPASAGPRLQLKRRSLTAGEREELADHIRRLRRRAWPVVATTVAVAIVVGLAWRDGLQPRDLFGGTSIAWYLLAAVSYAAYARRILAARKLELDRRLRWVVTVDDTGDEPGEPRPPRLEVLPVSQLAWTENADPAGWRLSRL